MLNPCNENVVPLNSKGEVAEYVGTDGISFVKAIVPAFVSGTIRAYPIVEPIILFIIGSVNVLFVNISVESFVIYKAPFDNCELDVNVRLITLEALIETKPDPVYVVSVGVIHEQVSTPLVDNI